MSFVQAGIGDQQTQSYVAGVTWQVPWKHQFSYVALSGRLEADFGRWSTRVNHSTSDSWCTELGVVPVLRVQRRPLSPWFMEIGVGPNYIAPIFHTGEKRFGTKFNFGDHVGIGRRFDTTHPIELALRTEHFSNAGIRHPNPGENFLQVRVSIAL